MSARLTFFAFFAVNLFFCLNSPPLCAKKTEETSTTETVFVQQLPPEAQQTLVLIHQSGPFPYKRDGIVFGNREKQLPVKPRGHYREYTVPTPGAENRGARRIVCGGKKPSTPDFCYYTADHYQSFQLIRNETAQP
jgi:ribonuclease T1